MKKPTSSRPDIITLISLWVFPTCALFITGYLLYDFYSQQGPMIKIEFDDAASIEPQRTMLRYRGVTVGHVDSVQLSPDTKKVTVLARLNADAKSVAVEGSQFWIIHPQLGFDGIRGLETIIKGPYIRVDIGKGPKKQRQFLGYIGDPELADAKAVKPFVLYAQEMKSIDTGDAVTFRGLKIGKVSKIELAENAQGVRVHINIEKNYAHLIRDKTVFWIKSAVDAKIGLFSADIKINSLDTIMRGGIAVATPNTPGDISPPQKVFGLQDTAPKDWINWAPQL
jgi:paraquat-inducible protein B